MYLKSFNKVDTNRYEVEVTVGGEEFSAAIDKAYKKNCKKIVIPGFRKGKAPRHFVEKYYGEDLFYEDAINEVYYSSLMKAAEEANLRILDDKTDFDLVKADKNGLHYKVRVTTYPEVSIEGYKGIEVTEKSTEVTEEDVQKEIDSVLKRNSRLVSVEDRAAQKGDVVNIDFEGFKDGDAFDGGKAENFSLELGSNQFIPGFEDQIIGHNVEESFDVNVKFPEDYAEETLAGQDAVFKVHLHEIKVREIPEFDDEFAKDVSEFDTIDEYKEDLKKKLIERKEEFAKNDKESQLMSKLAELVVADVPEVMIKNEIKLQVQEFSNKLRGQGLDEETYMQYSGMDRDSFEDMFRPKAEQSVKISLALEKIAELENLEVSEEDIENEYKNLSENYGIDIEKIKSMISEDHIKRDIVVARAIDLVRESSVTVEKPAEEAKEEAAVEENDKKEEVVEEATKENEETAEVEEAVKEEITEEPTEEKAEETAEEAKIEE